MRPLFVLALAVACGPPSNSDCVHAFYADADGDGHGVPDATLRGCIAPPGYETTHDDCDDRNSATHPGAAEQCNGIDDDCDGATDPFAPWYVDLDGDGYGNDDESRCGTPTLPSAAVGGDCDDSSAAVHPGADEICNGIDDDCQGTVDIDAVDGSTSYTDADGDGYGDDATVATLCEVSAKSVAMGGDCDDDRSWVNPSAFEVCDELDNDCDTLVDFDDPDLAMSAQYADDDEDGFGDPATTTDACTAIPGWVHDATDCDDAAPTVNPDGEERCNEIDDDCDGLTDDDDSPVTGRSVFYVDDDGDGLGTSPSVMKCFAPTGYADTHGDCDDSDASVGLPTTLYRDTDGDGYGGDADDRCATAGWILTGGDCDDTRSDAFPGAAEVCNVRDDNCDGLTDEDDPALVWPTRYGDADADGYGVDSMATVMSTCALDVGQAAVGGDCDDDNPWSHPTATEYCDDEDNDCDGSADDAVVYATWYVDDDGDAYGGDAVYTCEIPEGLAPSGSDCDDTSGTVHPGAAEVCVNGSDDDCDGVTDPCLVDLENADWSLVGPTTLGVSTLGYEVLAADLDADGVADLIAGAPDIDSPVYVFFGPLSGSSALDAADLTFDAIGASGLGDAMDAADADGDGTTDLLLGAPDDHIAYLFLGPVTSKRGVATADAELLAPDHGPSATIARIVPDFDGDESAEVAVNAIDLTASAREGTVYLAPATTTDTLSLPRNATYTYEGASYYELGASITPVGDTNGDGIDDLAVGATGRHAYDVFVLAGGEAAGTYSMADAPIGLLSSIRADRFGQSMDATDYDGDGYHDLFVGASTEGPSVYGFLGPFTDERNTDAADVRWIGADGLGFSVAAGGDVDGDGTPDVLLGAYSPDRYHGRAYLSLRGAEGVVDVEALLSFDGPADVDAVGYALAFVPDWTGDGNPEVAFGAPLITDPLSPGSGAGRVDVIFSENLY